VALQLRLYALYDLDKALLAVTAPISVLTVAFAAAVHAWALGQGKVTSHDLPGTPYCISRGIPETYWILWLPIIAFEASLLGLVVRRAVVDDYAEIDRRRRSIDSIEQLTKPGCSVSKQYIRDPWQRATQLVGIVSQSRRIFYVLIRDSVLYFFVYARLPHCRGLADEVKDGRVLCDEPRHMDNWDPDHAGVFHPILFRVRFRAMLPHAPQRA
jgi:hypothetical protein